MGSHRFLTSPRTTSEPDSWLPSTTSPRSRSTSATQLPSLPRTALPTGSRSSLPSPLAPPRRRLRQSQKHLRRSPTATWASISLDKLAWITSAFWAEAFLQHSPYVLLMFNGFEVLFYRRQNCFKLDQTLFLGGFVKPLFVTFCVHD